MELRIEEAWGENVRYAILIVMLMLCMLSVSGQWVRPVASGSAAGGVFTWFGAFNVSENVTSPVYCIGTYCIDTWPNMTIPGSYLNSSNLTFIRETINNSGEYNIFINYSNLLNAPKYTNMTDTKWNITGSKYLYNNSGVLDVNESATDNYTWSSDGLVFYAPFNGDALDYSGFGNDMSRSINTTTVNGKYGNAIYCNTTTSIINSSFNPTQFGNTTYSLWFKSNSNTNVGRLLEGFSTVEVFVWYLDSAAANKTRISIPFSTTSGIWDGNTTTVVDRNWTHLVLVWEYLNTSTPKIYINGQSIPLQTVSTPVGSPSYSITKLQICNRPDDLARSLIGYYDEVRIWNRSLSADEVMGLYKMKSEVYPPNSVRNVANMTLSGYDITGIRNYLYITMDNSGTAALGYRNSTSTYRGLRLIPDVSQASYFGFYRSGADANLVMQSTDDTAFQKDSCATGDDFILTTTGVTSITGGRVILRYNNTDRLMVATTGIAIGNGSLSNPSNGFLEVTANLSNRSIYAVGTIDAKDYYYHSEYPIDWSLEDTLRIKGTPDGKIDYSTVADSVKSHQPYTTTKKVNITQDVEKCEDVQVPTTKQVEYTDEFGIKSYYPETTYTTENQCKIVAETVETEVTDKVTIPEGISASKMDMGSTIAIQELYAENCAQMQVFIDKGLLKPEDIKMKHCDLVKQ